MQVQELFIYPVKSLSGIRVARAEALQRGFKFDRRWMLIDQTGRFITQRTEPRLALLQTEVSDTTILVNHKKFPEQKTEIPLSVNALEKIAVSIWDDEVEAVHLGNEIDSWFSNILQQVCKLVYMPENGIRPVDERYAAHGEQVGFADAFPYLLIGQSSLDDLNKRLVYPVPMNRFRPNIVITGSTAFEEDTWEEITIGPVHFKMAKPCSRCMLTTIDQDTGIGGKEPLNTLGKYRAVNNKVMFGQNLLALNEGTIHSNDPVKVIR